MNRNENELLFSLLKKGVEEEPSFFIDTMRFMHDLMILKNQKMLEHASTAEATLAMALYWNKLRKKDRENQLSAIKNNIEKFKDRSFIKWDWLFN